MANKQSGKKHQKLTAEQKRQRARAAEERERRAREAQAKSERTKKIFTVIICVILVLALGIPTIAISVMSGGQ